MQLNSSLFRLCCFNACVDDQTTPRCMGINLFLPANVVMRISEHLQTTLLRNIKNLQSL